MPMTSPSASSTVTISMARAAEAMSTRRNIAYSFFERGKLRGHIAPNRADDPVRSLARRKLRALDLGQRPLVARPGGDDDGDAVMSHCLPSAAVMLCVS
jgi:hypothetical protein